MSSKESISVPVSDGALLIGFAEPICIMASAGEQVFRREREFKFSQFGGFGCQLLM
ncbi:hypothetical protein [Roseobacter fucihabitans]|uniref:hypothetical protein n=1 Tax=Roseobacter fucihabitans TaxID=1537242 RepID=UPI00165315E2|nr:hypothetical protein [Roseobacter litoralis]